jgi:hypothetical protein
MADKHALREQSVRYSSDFGAKNTGLRLNNRHFRGNLCVKSISYSGPTRSSRSTWADKQAKETIREVRGQVLNHE